MLAEDLLLRYRERCETGPLRITSEACVALMQHEWPGNVRQLRNVIEGAAAVAGNDDVIRLPHVLQFVAPLTAVQAGNGDMPSLAQARKNAEQRAILEALGKVGGNRERAAKLLHISQATLYRKLGERAQQSA